MVADWGDPDLGELTNPKQQPVDFAVWQAADGTWQLWSCIRNTLCGGSTRLFHRWEGARLTDPDWEPMGIAMQADPAYGETPGGLQAPHVVRTIGRLLHVLRRLGEHLPRDERGRQDVRPPRPPERQDGMFTEGAGTNTRDPMVIRIGDVWHCYYTAFPNARGTRTTARTSTDLVDWSPARPVAFGGSAGTGPFSAECPFVVAPRLAATTTSSARSTTAKAAQTSVYRSR